MLSNRDLVELIDFRHLLHRHPELSGEERETAQRVANFIEPTRPDTLITGLGGHGVAAVYDSGVPGPALMFRSELDALPIFETSGIAHRSEVPGKGHLCGHDGHSTILLGLARLIDRQRPKRGRVVLLFQPAEETGAGAAAVIADPRFAGIKPDWSFALHNMPGIARGRVSLAEGPVNCASRGLRIVLAGKTSHASVPEAGISPAQAVSKLIAGLDELGPGGALEAGFKLTTITHVRVGEPAFGVAPGHGEVWVTLRAMTDRDMRELLADAETLSAKEAKAAGLGLELSHHDIFQSCENNPDATIHLRAALDAEGVRHDKGVLPMRGSEDFGLFGAHSKSAMFFLGAGETHPMVHNPDFDFPDELIATGVRVFDRVVRSFLG